MKQEFKARRALMIKLLSQIKGLELNKPEGAFYIFPNICKFIEKKHPVTGEKIKNCDELAIFLLENAGVATVSGAAFGAENYLRISYAAKEKDLIKACKLIKQALENLK